jgi:hypothetical protein
MIRLQNSQHPNVSQAQPRSTTSSVGGENEGETLFESSCKNAENIV